MTDRYGPTEHVAWLDVGGAAHRPAAVGKEHWAGKLETIRVPHPTLDARAAAARNLLAFDAADLAEALGLTIELERARWEVVVSYVEEAT